MKKKICGLYLRVSTEDQENKRRVHKLGIIYVIRDDGTLLKEEDDVFNYIPSKNDEKLILVNTNSLKKD